MADWTWTDPIADADLFNYRFVNLFVDQMNALSAGILSILEPIGAVNNFSSCWPYVQWYNSSPYSFAELSSGARAQWIRDSSDVITGLGVPWSFQAYLYGSAAAIRSYRAGTLASDATRNASTPGYMNTTTGVEGDLAFSSPLLAGPYPTGLRFTKYRPREIWQWPDTYGLLYFQTSPLQHPALSPPAGFELSISPNGWFQGYSSDIESYTGSLVRTWCCCNTPAAGQRAYRRSMRLSETGGLISTQPSLDNQVYVYDGTEWSLDSDPTARPDVLSNLWIPPNSLMWSVPRPDDKPYSYYPYFAPNPDARLGSGQAYSGLVDGDVVGPWIFDEIRDYINLGYIDDTTRASGSLYTPTDPDDGCFYSLLASIPAVA